MTRTWTKVSILMMRPSRKGNRGARIAKAVKNAKNRDHGRLLQKCEEAQSGSLSDHASFWPDHGVSFRRLRGSCELQWPRLFEIKTC